ncbi:MAG: nucleotide exchange factor GrpE [Chloroflexi bacterium]|nr:nucleotide exchange factor GrpE [Chloroflexota bacterium]
MSARRNVWATLARLLQRLENDVDILYGSSRAPDAGNGLTNLEKEVRKLGKTQFKANVLAEDQFARLEKTLAAAQSSQEENNHLLEMLADERVAAAQKNLLEAVLPALDGLDNAISSGQRYLKKRDLAAHKPDQTPAQTILVSPADRAMLAGWLGGLRVVRERLLAILEAGNVNPIPTVGLPFDPYLHIVVGTTSEAPAGMEPIPGIIVAEDRCGYQSPAGVLRYAEVIVYRPN